MKDLSYRRTIEANRTKVEKTQLLAILFCLSHAAETGLYKVYFRSKHFKDEYRWEMISCKRDIHFVWDTNEWTITVTSITVPASYLEFCATKSVRILILVEESLFYCILSFFFFSEKLRSLSIIVPLPGTKFKILHGIYIYYM